MKTDFPFPLRRDLALSSTAGEKASPHYSHQCWFSQLCSHVAALSPLALEKPSEETGEGRGVVTVKCICKASLG